MSITPKDWNKFQHYKDRSPPWIKLHKTLLDDYEFACLPVASRALAPLLWLLASEYEGGQIPAMFAKIAFRLHMTEQEVIAAIKPLVNAGFFVDASGLLAGRKQDAMLEEEGETEVEKEKDICTVADATRTKRKKDYSEKFENFWKSYPRTPTMSKTEAWKPWQRLSEDDQDRAISAVPKYVDWLREHPRIETVHACRFLSQRRFDGLVDAAAENDPAESDADREFREAMWKKREQYLKEMENGRDQSVQLSREGSGICEADEMVPVPEGAREVRGGSADEAGSDNHARKSGFRGVGEIFSNAPPLVSGRVQTSGAGVDQSNDRPRRATGVVR